MMSSKQPRAAYDFCHLSYLVRLMLLMMVAYSFSRTLFYLYNFQGDLNFIDWVQASLHGLRFDLYAVVLINVPLLLWTIFLGFYHRTNNYKWLHLLFWLCNLPCLMTNFFDIAFFPFSGKRTGKDILMYFVDSTVKQQSSQLIQYYFLGILLIGFAIFFTIKWSTLSHRSLTIRRKHSGLFVLFILCSITLSIRGGFQKAPLRVFHAIQWPSEKLAPVTLNTPFTFVRQKNADVRLYDWFASYKDALQVFESSKIEQTMSELKPKNVVLIILESFSYEFIQDIEGEKEHAPFLKSLAKKSLFFDNGFANASRSMHAAPCVLLGRPHLFNEAFVRTSFYKNKYSSLSSIIRRYGYETSFYHGNYNGSKFLDSFSKKVGFQSYHGFTEYKKRFPEKGNEQGTLGVFDHNFLHYVLDDLEQRESPFLATIFTLSSHQPYDLPKEYEHMFKKEDYSHPLLRSVHYADTAMKDFFDKMKEKSWYKDTVFVFTSDHPGRYETKYKYEPLGWYRIPIFIYDPSGDLPAGHSQKVVQQADIPATVLDYLGIYEQEKKYLTPFSQSMLNEDESGYALIARSSNSYTMVQDEKIATYDKSLDKFVIEDLPEKYFRVRHKFSQTDDELKQRFKAYIQLYNNGLLENKMSRASFVSK